MESIVFDGRAEAKKREEILRQRVAGLSRPPRLCSVIFVEDEGGQLYTRLKMQAALRVGIEFDTHEFSVKDPVDLVREEIRLISGRHDASGILIQKPTKQTWHDARQTQRPGEFKAWWQQLVSVLDPQKDVDCLTKQNLDLVYSSNWRILPATVKAVLSILELGLGLEHHDLTDLNEIKLKRPLTGLKTVVVGRSEIVGRPLHAVLVQAGATAELVGSGTEDLGVYTAGAKIVVSATGVPGLIKEDLIRPGAMVIDVGSPHGDVDFEAVRDEAAFITPVPGGVGPMTVVSLLENLVGMV